LYQAMPQVVVDLCRGNPWPQRFGRPKHGVFDRQRRGDVSFCKVVQRTPGKPLDNLGQQDNAQVRINFPCAWLVFQRLPEDLR
jgi:hypothetical protein